VELATFRKPKAMYFLSYVEYRPNTSNIMKKDHANGRSLMGEGREKKEIKVNMVDVLSMQE
jgi:hypothetical protein